MADLDQAVLDSPNVEQAAAQELRRGRLRQQQQVQRSARNVARKARTNPVAVVDAVKQEAEQAINQAYTMLWQRGHEVIEGLAFQFFFLGALLAGPLVAVMFLIRFLVGNAFNGGFELEFQGIRVKAIPPMSTTELVYRGGKDLFIILLSGIEWAILIFISMVLIDPTFAARVGLEAIFHPSSGLQSTPNTVNPLR